MIASCSCQYAAESVGLGLVVDRGLLQIRLRWQSQFHPPPFSTGCNLTVSYQMILFRSNDVTISRHFVTCDSSVSCVLSSAVPHRTVLVILCCCFFSKMLTFFTLEQQFGPSVRCDWELLLLFDIMCRYMYVLFSFETCAKS